jgi:hypothetical protein
MEGEKSKFLSEILLLGRMISICFMFLFISGIFYNAISDSESKAPNARMTSSL